MGSACGCSTAIGFGSLCFASNDALASLGAVAVTGILISMLVSVFPLPSWHAVRPEFEERRFASGHVRCAPIPNRRGP